MKTARLPRWERRPEERPQELLDAALDVFAERGYRVTRLEEVAERAGVSKGAVYHYFGGKEDLLVQAVESRIAATFTDIDRVLAHQNGPASVKLRLALRRAWQFWTTREFGQMFRLMFGEIRNEFPHLFEKWILQGPVHGWEMLARLIEEGKRNGEFRPDADAEAAARFITCGLAFQAVLQVHAEVPGLRPLDPDRIFDSTADLFLRGLRDGPGG